MSTYAFRITCTLADGHLETKENAVQLQLPASARPINVFPSNHEDHTDKQSLVLWCGEFNSEGEARAAGVAVKQAVMLAGVSLAIGIDLGSDNVISPAAQRKDGRPDQRLQPDVHALQVVPEIEGLRFGFLRVGLPFRRISTTSFEKSVADGHGLRGQLTKKQILAAQLYNQSHFLSSDAARFITLTSAVEVLTEERYSSSTAVRLVERFIKMTEKVSLEDWEKQSLKKRLGNLKRELIGSACRTLVRTLCGSATETP